MSLVLVMVIPSLSNYHVPFVNTSHYVCWSYLLTDFWWYLVCSAYIDCLDSRTGNLISLKCLQQVSLACHIVFTIVIFNWILCFGQWIRYKCAREVSCDCFANLKYLRWTFRRWSSSKAPSASILVWVYRIRRYFCNIKMPLQIYFCTSPSR